MRIIFYISSLTKSLRNFHRQKLIFWSWLDLHRDRHVCFGIVIIQCMQQTTPWRSITAPRMFDTRVHRLFVLFTTICSGLLTLLQIQHFKTFDDVAAFTAFQLL